MTISKDQVETEVVRPRASHSANKHVVFLDFFFLFAANVVKDESHQTIRVKQNFMAIRGQFGHSLQQEKV